MMPNSFTDALFQLVRSLEKSEKRHFKLYIKRSSGKEYLKIIQLFDALEKLHEYDEKLLISKLKGVTKPQLANLKTHLYKQLLSSLRLLKTTENTDLQLSEHLDHARLLYNKGLKIQSLRILEKAKELAKTNQKFNFLAQVISLEKKIETLHITRSTLERTEDLATEALAISAHIDRVTRLSNLALLLYRWYVKFGHARNVEDEKDIRAFFKSNIPDDIHAINGFYENLYLYQSYCWYAFIRQDFLMYYRYSEKWINLFEANPTMIAVETGHFIKGVHNLLNAHFDLRNDLQCYARLMHLMAHYELGNDEIIESLIKSVYRFMAKMKNLTVVEEEMFRFLRSSFRVSPRQLKPELEKFLYKIKHLEKNRFETRAFAYLDVISWVESKVYGKPLAAIIHEKHLQSNRSAVKTPKVLHKAF
jgi:hypothetical protein